MGLLTDSMTVSGISGISEILNFEDFEGAAEFQQHYAQLNAEGRFECFDHSKSIEPRRTDGRGNMVKHISLQWPVQLEMILGLAVFFPPFLSYLKDLHLCSCFLRFRNLCRGQ
jgi:hypothetical protein